jgi:hypothetical protein
MEALEVAKKRILQEKLPTLAAIGAALDRIEKTKSLLELEWTISSLRSLAWGLDVEYGWFAMYMRGRWRTIQAPVQIEGGDKVVGPFPRREDARIWIRASRSSTNGVPSTIHNRLVASNN